MLETLAGALGSDILVVIYGQMPAGEDEETRSAARRRHLVKAAAWGILTLALYFILAALGRYLDELRTRTYNSMPYMLLQTCVIPLPLPVGAPLWIWRLSYSIFPHVLFFFIGMLFYLGFDM
jgi:hypothetical protein